LSGKTHPAFVNASPNLKFPLRLLKEWLYILIPVGQEQATEKNQKEPNYLSIKMLFLQREKVSKNM